MCSPRNCFVFTPLLAASCVGTVDTMSITEVSRAQHVRDLHAYAAVHMCYDSQCLLAKTAAPAPAAADVTVAAACIDQFHMVLLSSVLACRHGSSAAACFQQHVFSS